MADQPSNSVSPVLNSLRMLDLCFHTNAPKAEKLQGDTSIELLRHQFGSAPNVAGTTLHSLISVSFLLSDGAVQRPITPSNSGKIALSFDIVVDVLVCLPESDAPSLNGRHAALGSDPQTMAMKSALVRSSFESAYSFASSRLIEASSMSPLGLVTMPQPDYQSLLDKLDI